MELTLTIRNDNKVDVVKDSCEAVQSESNVTIFNIVYPQEIKGYPIANYTKFIEFGECKELGECVKFFDRVEGDSYTLDKVCTQFSKVMVQFVFKNVVDEAEEIVWKTVPFALEFCESINAEGNKQIQSQLLNLDEIEEAWENYIKSNTLRMVYRVGDVPTADAKSEGDTIFYLGANSTEPYTLEYGHYYRCVVSEGVYMWVDLTNDPSIVGEANGIREINKSQVLQFWVGTKEELEQEITQDNVVYIPIDHDMVATIDDLLTGMIGGNGELLLDEGTKHIPVLGGKLSTEENDILTYNGVRVSRELLRWTGNGDLQNNEVLVYESDSAIANRRFKAEISFLEGSSIIVEFRATHGQETIRPFYTHSQFFANTGLVRVQINARYYENNLYISGAVTLLTNLTGSATVYDGLSTRLKNVWEIVE